MNSQEISPPRVYGMEVCGNFAASLVVHTRIIKQILCFLVLELACRSPLPSISLFNQIYNHTIDKEIMAIFYTILLSICVALGVSSAPTVDPKTGITFETYRDPKGYYFGIAAPPTPTTDFIGQLVNSAFQIIFNPQTNITRLYPAQQPAMAVSPSAEK